MALYHGTANHSYAAPNVNKEQKHAHKRPWWSLFIDIGVTIGEVVGSIVAPELTIPLAIASTAIRTVNDVAGTGQLNVVNLGIDVASTFVPFLHEEISASRMVKNVNRNLDRVFELELERTKSFAMSTSNLDLQNDLKEIRKLKQSTLRNTRQEMEKYYKKLKQTSDKYRELQKQELLTYQTTKYKANAAFNSIVEHNYSSYVPKRGVRIDKKKLKFYYGKSNDANIRQYNLFNAYGDSSLNRAKKMLDRSNLTRFTRSHYESEYNKIKDDIAGEFSRLSKYYKMLNQNELKETLGYMAELQVDTFKQTYKFGIRKEDVLKNLQQSDDILNTYGMWRKDLFDTLLLSKRQFANRWEHQMGMAVMSKFKSIAPELSEQLDTLIGAAKTRAIDDGQIRMFVAQLHNQLNEQQLLLLRYELDDFTTQVLHSLGGNYSNNKFSRIIRNLGSKKFNEKFVQKAQLIDPNDMGRAPIEGLYQFFKRKYKDWIKKTEEDPYLKGWKKKVVAARKASQRTLGKQIITDEERALTKLGYQLVGGARSYLVGYKVIPVAVGRHKNMIMLTFNRENTKAIKTTHLQNGKRDVLCIATDKDLRELRARGAEYYWLVGHRKGWWKSTGKKYSIGAGAMEISSDLSLFLSVVPIPALRNVLSITSNWVENGYSIVNMAVNRTGKSFLHNWVASLERSFIRSGLNRTSRLLTRVVVGETFKQKALGDNVGKMRKAFYKRIGAESQRFATITLSTFEGTDKNGFFTFKPITNGSSFARKVGLGVMTSGRSAAFRATRKTVNGVKRNTSGRRKYGAVRKFGQVRRIVSAVTPNKNVKTRGFGRIII